MKAFARGWHRAKERASSAHSDGGGERASARGNGGAEWTTNGSFTMRRQTDDSPTPKLEPSVSHGPAESATAEVELQVQSSYASSTRSEAGNSMRVRPSVHGSTSAQGSSSTGIFFEFDDSDGSRLFGAAWDQLVPQDASTFLIVEATVRGAGTSRRVRIWRQHANLNASGGRFEPYDVARRSPPWAEGDELRDVSIVEVCVGGVIRAPPREPQHQATEAAEGHDPPRAIPTIVREVSPASPSVARESSWKVEEVSNGSSLLTEESSGAVRIS